MKPVRKLTLRKEMLVDLTTGEMSRVAAGAFTRDVVACTRQTLTMCPNYYCTGTC